MRRGKRRTHLLHRADDIVDETWDAKRSRTSAVHRVGAVTLDEHVERDTENACAQEKS